MNHKKKEEKRIKRGLMNNTCVIIDPRLVVADGLKMRMQLAGRGGYKFGIVIRPKIAYVSQEGFIFATALALAKHRSKKF